MYQIVDVRLAEGGKLFFEDQKKEKAELMVLVYVDYVETAPWNIKQVTSALGTQPKFGGVGTRLIEAAVSTFRIKPRGPEQMTNLKLGT